MFKKSTLSFSAVDLAIAISIPYSCSLISKHYSTIHMHIYKVCFMGVTSLYICLHDILKCIKV